MNAKKIFEFLNSAGWVAHTHQQYRTPEEILYRLRSENLERAEQIKLQEEIILHRKMNAIPFFIETLDKKFWFFPSDSILQKAQDIEKLGNQLHQKITENPDFKEEFMRDSKVEEAITSAIYEGANSTRAKAQELIESGNAPKNKDEWMLINNFHAMNWIKNNLDKPLTHELVLDLHRIVTQNTHEGDDANFSGKFRNDTVYVRSNGGVKHEGIPFAKINPTLNEVVRLTTQHPRYFPKIIRGMLIHYFIAYIHPFFDGNGRTARALFYFKSMKNNLNFVELLSVSAYLKNNGRQYEKSFDKVIDNGLDMTYFIDFNLDALLEAIRIVEKKVIYLTSIPKLKNVLNVSNTQIGLLQRLSLNKFRMVSIEDYAAQMKKSREISRQELKELSDLNLIEETKLGKKFVYKVMKSNLDKILEQQKK